MAAVHHLRRPPCTTGNGTNAPSSAERVHHGAGIIAPWPAECLHHQAGVRRIGIALTELPPSGREEGSGELIFKDYMELVNEHMSALSSLPVQRNTVKHRVRDNQ